MIYRVWLQPIRIAKAGMSDSRHSGVNRFIKQSLLRIKMDDTISAMPICSTVYHIRYVILNHDMTVVYSLANLKEQNKFGSDIFNELRM